MITSKYEATIKVIVEDKGEQCKLRSTSEINAAIIESLMCDGVSSVEIIESNIETEEAM